MALSVDLAEELTCPIDLELYEEPMLLKCLHVLCEKDVTKLTDGDGFLQCPLCKIVSEKQDIKRDFRTKRLIELHQAHKGRLEGKQLCDACMDKVATARCRECQMYFDEQCQIGHLKIPATKDHTFERLADAREKVENRQNIENLINLLESSHEIYDQFKLSWESRKSDIDKKFTDALGEISALEYETMSRVTETFNRLRLILKDKNSVVTKEVKDGFENATKSRDGLLKDLQMLKNILDDQEEKVLMDKELVHQLIEHSEQNYHTFKTYVENTPKSELQILITSNKNFLKELEFLEVNLNSDTIGLGKGTVPLAQGEEDLPLEEESQDCYASQSCQPVDCSGEWSEFPSEASSPKLSNTNSAQKQYSKRACASGAQAAEMTSQPGLLSKYVGRNFRPSVLYKYKRNSPRRIEFIDDYLWTIMADDSIEILRYDQTRAHFKKAIWIHDETSMWNIVKKTIKYKACAVKQSHFGILAACHGTKDEKDCFQATPGLVVVDEYGLIQDVITGGRYYDVAAHGRYIYGLAYEYVTIHEKRAKGWTSIREVRLNSDYRDICVYNFTLVLSGGKQNDVKKYNLRTNSSSSVVPTDFRSPRLCLCDAAGNSLICDSQLNQLGVQVQEDTWCPIRVHGGQLVDAVVDASGDLLVINVLDKTLVKLITWK